MKITSLNKQVSVSEQIHESDIAYLKTAGVQHIICNRPDAESADQPEFKAIAKLAEDVGMSCTLIAFSGGDMTDAQVAEFQACLVSGKRIHAYCRTGNRSTKIWERASQHSLQHATSHSAAIAIANFEVVIVGAGSGGIATAASLLKRNPNLRIAIIDPATMHYYQPAWTLVGGGAFNVKKTARSMASVMPSGVTWLNDSVAVFEPDNNLVQLKNGQAVHYQHLVIAPGLELNWQAIEGLKDTMGQNGVTSNYDVNLAPYTFDLVKNFTGGNAVFTQPAMPIKCAGAPQKAMYLSADYWLKNNVLKNTKVHFYNAGAVLFGVKEYLPALQHYVERYSIQLHMQHHLTKVDGANKKAWFSSTTADGNQAIVETQFDMLHVCPPQRSPGFIRESSLADENGWLSVNPQSLQHSQHPTIWGVGDVINAPNAKTMAAVRKQAPVVAHNIVRALSGLMPNAEYDGYGSCPLTVENGKIVLAEFTYGGKLSPSFPRWLNNGTEATTLAWHLKADILPPFYWHGMLKGREWLASPKIVGR